MNKRIFWGGVVLGGCAMAYGVRGLVLERAAADPFAVARLFLTSALVHDALVAPAAFAVGLLVVRAVPGWARAPVQVGLFFTAVLSLYAWPFVRGYGRAATNPSALPLNYGLGLGVVLALVWTGVGVALAVRALGRRPAASGRHEKGSVAS